jgi:type I restriction enzyme S subunit
VTGKQLKNNQILLEDAYFISEQDYEKIIVRSGLEVGDVLFTTIGTVGEICRVTEPAEYAIKNIGVFRPREVSDSLWLYYYFLSPQGRKQINDSKRGSTQQFVGLKELRNFLIPTPGDARYRANQVALLDRIDRQLTLNRQSLITLESIAQAIFKSWFVDFDPVHAKSRGEQPQGMDAETAALFPDSFEESELGLIPSGWKVAPAGSIFDMSIGRTPPRKEPQWFLDGSEGVPWVSIRDMGTFGLFSNATSESLSESAVGRFRVPVVPPGTVLMSFKLTVGKLCIASEHLATNEAIAHFRTRDAQSPSPAFTFLWLSNFDIESLDSTSSIATATNSNQIKQIKFLLPDTEVLEVFQSQVAVMFEKIQILSKQTATLMQIRDSLLPRLISGELEIPDELLVH